MIPKIETLACTLVWSLRAILVVKEAVEGGSPPSPGQVMMIRIRYDKED